MVGSQDPRSEIYRVELAFIVLRYNEEDRVRVNV